LAKTRDLTFAKLVWKTGNGSRCCPGSFRFGFGQLEYVDGPSLRSQYEEIFLQRIYEFFCGSNTPFILDCGGNIGLSTVWFKLRYPESQIVVFEADPALSVVLQRNLSALRMSGVEVVNAAVWNETGNVGFRPDRADGGHVAAKGGQVPCVRLADYITERVDFLKLDIEGAEYPVLLDLCESGKIRYVMRLACEIHGSSSHRLKLPAILAALAEAGFRFTFDRARTASDLPAPAEATAFAGVPDAKFLLQLYAWRPEAEPPSPGE
jgi:FkbM family methyltransferase